MFAYIIKRLLLFIPVFFIVSMIAFGLSQLAPGDPAAAKTEFEVNSLAALQAQRRAYRQTAVDMGLNLPAFYATITTQAQSDTLHRVLPLATRDALRQLTHEFGNWEAIQAYYHQLLATEKVVLNLPDSLRKSDSGIAKRQMIESLFITHNSRVIANKIEKLLSKTNDIDAPALQQLQTAYNNVLASATPRQKYLPALHWYGTPNRYHRWMSRFLQGDFGISQRDYQPVADKIKAGLKWTLWINIPAILLTFLLSIPLGVWSAWKADEWTDRTISVVLFFLYSLPSFWIATLLIIFLTTPQYGLDWFASVGLGNATIERDGVWTVFWERAAHLLLPIFCVTYASLAFITRQMRAAMIEVLSKDYIRTAKAKGLPMHTVIWKHAFRNALFPLITIFGSLLPSLIAGSIIIEFVFNIKGMGWLLYDSIYAQDWSVVFAILMIGAVLTMVGLLLADVLYALADPRVRLA
ncbi:MAG: ABC transporter permease [Bacteroidota bacterium]